MRPTFCVIAIGDSKTPITKMVKMATDLIADLQLNEGGKFVAKLYRFNCEVMIRVKADNLEQAKELLKNGFYHDFEIREVKDV